MRIRVFALVVMAVLTSGCAALPRQAAGSSPGAVPQATPIPWTSATPATLMLPTPTPTLIPANTHLCHASDLVAVFGGIGALTGGQLAASVLFGNRTASACVVQGVPVVQLFDRAGHQIALNAVDGQGMRSDPVLIQPGTGDVQPHVQRDGVGYVEMDWGTHDGAGNPCIPSPSQASAVAVAFPAGGGTLRVAVSDSLSRWSTIAPCYGRLSVSPFQSWPAPEPSATPNPLSSLAIHVEAPASIAAGSTLHYTVSLENAGKEPIVFPADCPVYGEWSAFAKDFYVLNCRPVGPIPPGQSARFAMSISVPPGTATGQYTLVWTFVKTLDLKMPVATVPLTVTG